MFEHILVPLDESPSAECVLDHVAELAGLTGARVTLVRVLEVPTMAGQVQPTDPVAWQLHQDTAAAYLSGVAQRLASRGVTATGRILEGRPANRILVHAHGDDVDLVAVATHGRGGIGGSELGAVAHQTILGARVTVLLVRSFAPRPRDAPDVRYRRVLVPLDGSTRAECVLPILHRVAARSAASLLLVHVLRPPELPHRLPLDDDEQRLVDGLRAVARRHARAYLDRLGADLTKAGCHVGVHVLDGDEPAATLEEFAAIEDVDLMVMSAHGATGSTRRPFGAVAQQVLLYGAQTTLIVQDRAREEIRPSPARAAAHELARHA